MSQVQVPVFGCSKRTSNSQLFVCLPPSSSPLFEHWRIDKKMQISLYRALTVGRGQLPRRWSEDGPSELTESELTVDRVIWSLPQPLPQGIGYGLNRGYVLSSGGVEVRDNGVVVSDNQSGTTGSGDVHRVRRLGTSSMYCCRYKCQRRGEAVEEV